MKNLEADITEIVGASALVVDAGIAHPGLGATPAETVKKIMEAISNYVRSVEEATCFLLELLPDPLIASLNYHTLLINPDQPLGPICPFSH